MGITCKKQRISIIFLLCHVTNGEKIEYTKMSYFFFTSEDKTKPNSTEFSFFYYNG